MERERERRVWTERWNCHIKDRRVFIFRLLKKMSYLDLITEILPLKKKHPVKHANRKKLHCLLVWIMRLPLRKLILLQHAHPPRHQENSIFRKGMVLIMTR